jgi:hypothetical protein
VSSLPGPVTSLLRRTSASDQAVALELFEQLYIELNSSA